MAKLVLRERFPNPPILLGDLLGMYLSFGEMMFFDPSFHARNSENVALKMALREAFPRLYPAHVVELAGSPEHLVWVDWDSEVPHTMDSAVPP